MQLRDNPVLLSTDQNEKWCWIVPSIIFVTSGPWLLTIVGYAVSNCLTNKLITVLFTCGIINWMLSILFFGYVRGQSYLAYGFMLWRTSSKNLLKIHQVKNISTNVTTKKFLFLNQWKQYKFAFYACLPSSASTSASTPTSVWRWLCTTHPPTHPDK